MNKIYNKSSEEMDELSDKSVDLIVTSPPYNVGKEYEKNFSKESYEKLLNTVFKECFRVLKDDGRICVNVIDNFLIRQILTKIGFIFRTEIIWYKGKGFNKKTAWGSFQSAKNPHVRGTHEYILVFEKKLKSKGVGENTISKDEFLLASRSVWYIHAVKSKIHPAVFPLELPKRLIEFYSYKNDLVLDPFAGTRTTLKAAKLVGRNYVGYEVNKEYIGAGDRT